MVGRELVSSHSYQEPARSYVNAVQYFLVPQNAGYLLTAKRNQEVDSASWTASHWRWRIHGSSKCQ